MTGTWMAEARSMHRTCWLLAGTLFVACNTPSPVLEGDVQLDGGPSAAFDAGPGASPIGPYEYSGCPNDDQGCPRLLTVLCAVERIWSTHRSCTQDADCALASFDHRCTGMSTCPLAVASTKRAQFEAEVQAEIDRYCQSTVCVVSESGCGSNTPEQFVAVCVAGTCRAELRDAGM